MNRLGSSAALVAFLAPLLVCLGLFWPLPLHLATWHATSAFGDSHVWVWDHQWRALTEGAALDPTCAAGYPFWRSFRAIGQGPGLVVMALRPLLGPLGAANLVQLMSLPLSALVAAVLVRRWTGVAPMVAAALGGIYALCPNLLATLATLEISNSQAWIPPAFFLALDQAGRSRWGLVGVGLVGILSAFTSPYLALALPLIAGVWALATGWRSWGAALRALLVIAVLFLSLLPARSYYQPAETGGSTSLFKPARASDIQEDFVVQPPPVAQLDRMLLGSGGPAQAPREVQHGVYLGAGLLLAAGGILLLRRRLDARGLARVVGGSLLAMGPFLALNDSFLVFGLRLQLPVILLEKLGYPTQLGGLYFRYVALVSLGLVVIVGRGLRGWRFAVPFAWALFLLQVVQGIADTGPFWPRPVGPVAGIDALRGLAGTDGAVLELPLQLSDRDDWLGQEALLRAVFHGRPTSALPRDPSALRSTIGASLTRLATDSEAGRAELSGLGFRYLLLPADRAKEATPSLQLLARGLGPPARQEGLLIWDLGPTELACEVGVPRGRGRRPAN